MKKSIISIIVYAIGNCVSILESIVFIAQNCSVSEDLAGHWLAKIINLDPTLILANPKYAPVNLS